MGSFSIQLPTGSNLTHVICLPKSGGWVGMVGFGLSSAANATIKSATLYYDEGGVPLWGRRVGGTSAGNWQNWTLPQYSRYFWRLLAGESVLKLNYDATSTLSVNIETNRSLIPAAHPKVAGNYGTPTTGVIFQL